MYREAEKEGFSLAQNEQQNSGERPWRELAVLPFSLDVILDLLLSTNGEHKCSNTFMMCEFNMHV